MINIEIKLNGDWVPLTKPSGGWKLIIEARNPIFDLSKIDQFNTLEFKVPAYGNIQQAIGHLYLIEVYEDYPFSLPCRIIINGRPYKQGILKVSDEITEENYSAFFISSGRSFFDKVNKTKLEDMVLDTYAGAVYDETLATDLLVKQDIIDKLKARSSQNYPAVDFAFPKMLNPNFYDFQKITDTNTPPNDILAETPYKGVINDNYVAITTFGGMANIEEFFLEDPTNPLQVPPITPTPYRVPIALVPMPYLSAVLRLISEEFGYTSSGIFETDGNLRSIVLYNIHALDKNVHATTWRECFHPDVKLSNHVPSEIKVDEFITSIQSFLLCFVIVDEIEENTEWLFIQDVITDNSYVEDWSQYVKEGYTKNIVERGYSLEYSFDSNNKYAKPVTSPKIYEYNTTDTYQFPTTGLVSGEHMYAEIIRGVYGYLKQVPPIRVVHEYDDFNQLIAVHLLGQSGAAPFIYYPTHVINETIIEDQVEYVGHNIDNVYLGDRKTQIKTKISPLSNHVQDMKIVGPVWLLGPAGDYPTFKYAIATNKGRTPRFKHNTDKKNPFSLMYSTYVEKEADFLYTEWQLIGHTSAYNMLSNPTAQTLYNNKYYDFNLWWDGPDGIIEAKGQEYLGIIAKKTTVKRTLYMPITAIQAISWKRPKVWVDRVRYIIQAYKASITENAELFEVEFELVIDRV